MTDLGSLSPPTGTRVSDRQAGLAARAAKLWPVAYGIGGVIVGILIAVYGWGIANATAAAKTVRLESDVVAIKSDLGKIEPLRSTVDRLDERTKAMKESIDRMERIVAPRDPAERINMMTQDTRVRP